MRNIKGPRFQARHYEAIAEHINKSFMAIENRKEYARILIPLFKADNPKFSADRFIAAACDDKR